jgi:hypothetical protein
VAQKFVAKVLLANAPSDFHVSNLEGATSEHNFTCDEDVKCAIITWLMQQVVRSVCLGWAN